MSRESLIEEVRRELAAKTKQQIEAETADRWAARAIVSYENYAAAREVNRARPSLEHEAEAVTWLTAAVEYEHEAVEHAGEAWTVDVVRSAIDEAKAKVGLPVVEKRASAG